MPFNRNFFFSIILSLFLSLQAWKVGSQRGHSLHNSHPTLPYRPAAPGPERERCVAGLGWVQGATCSLGLIAL